MAYSEQEMHEIERDPVRLKAYCWHMVQYWRRLAAQKRTASRTGLVSFEEGAEEIRWAGILEECANIIESDFDGWVKSMLVEDSQ